MAERSTSSNILITEGNMKVTFSSLFHSQKKDSHKIHSLIQRFSSLNSDLQTLAQLLRFKRGDC